MKFYALANYAQAPTFATTHFLKQIIYKIKTSVLPVNSNLFFIKAFLNAPKKIILKKYEYAQIVLCKM